MADIKLMSPTGREYTVSTWPIESELKLSNWISTNCVLVITKEDSSTGENRLISIWDVAGAGVIVGTHFGQWHSIDEDGRPTHIDRQLEATDYGVIHCEDAHQARALTDKLRKSNSALFDELRKKSVERK